MKNSKVVNINADLKGLMKHWLTFIKPFHKLRPQPQDILALLLFYYFEYKKVIKSEDMIWKMVFDYDTKQLIKKELNDMPDYTLQNGLTTLRKQNVIKGNKINRAFVPDLDLNAKSFKIEFNFKITE